MKNKAIEIIAFILGLLTTVAGILTLPQVALLPKEWQPIIGLCLALVIVGKNGAYLVMDFLDDGVLNQSYKLPKGLTVWLLCGLALMLTSCAGVTAFLASPLGRTAVVTAQALGKQLAKATEVRVLEQIIVKAESSMAALKAQGVNENVAKEILRQSEISGLQAVIDTAQDKYQTLTGARYVVPKQPVGVVTPK